MEGIAGKVVLVTGASSGIGYATAEELARRGARVMLTARRGDRLAGLCSRIIGDGGEASYMTADVTDRSAVSAVAEEAIQKYGQLDVLFNNAGIMPLSFMRNLKVEEWDRMIDVNIKGLLYAVAAVLPHMRGRGQGHIINVASTAGHRVFPGSAVYSATKHAVIAVSEGLRRELTADSRIRVTIISPGATTSELSSTITDEEILRIRKNTAPFTPLSASSIAHAAIYAISQPENVDVNEILVRSVTQAA